MSVTLSPAKILLTDRQNDQLHTSNYKKKLDTTIIMMEVITQCCDSLNFIAHFDTIRPHVVVHSNSTCLAIQIESQYCRLPAFTCALLLLFALQNTQHVQASIMPNS